MTLPPLFDECKYCHHNRAEHDSESGKFCSSELTKEDFDRGRVGKFCGCTHFVKIEPTHVIKEYHSPQLLQLRLEKHVTDAATKWFELEKELEHWMFNGEIQTGDTIKESMIEVLGKKVVLLMKKEERR